MKTNERSGSIELKPGDKMAIVAGGGRLPVDLAESLVARGQNPFVVMTQGEASADLASFDHEELALENFASLGRLLKKQDVTYAVFARGIGR